MSLVDFKWLKSKENLKFISDITAVNMLLKEKYMQ